MKYKWAESKRRGNDIKGNGLKNTSLTDWDRVDGLEDEDIDTGDIRMLDEEFFLNAELVLPEPKRGEK